MPASCPEPVDFEAQCTGRGGAILEHRNAEIGAFEAGPIGPGSVFPCPGVVTPSVSHAGPRAMA